MRQSATQADRPADRRCTFGLLSLLLVLLTLVLTLPATAFAFVSTGDGAWVWQYPKPQGNDLYSVDFAGASHA